ncbi:cysteine rich repeat-containing protein [Bradyrhizobium roseum]|uniref:cysteine rich repeat-containing protein n=1 Tax=Bradyrhizobium roseum TaxID=3056648 RepID=UPI00260B830F|nr:cysteine rich repeat-containing protein [Bradyrhizobium roseus]WKA27830.1 cysteine rich repeat-containing protein [Bradyrhizobium roseus]
MPTQRIVLSLAVAIAGIGAATSASSQENRGTWEQQMACTPDVWRLCGDKVPDVGRIVACLQQNTPQLSSGCRAVFDSSAEQQQASRMPPPRGQQMAPRGRAQQQLPPPPAVQPQPRPYYEEDE